VHWRARVVSDICVPSRSHAAAWASSAASLCAGAQKVMPNGMPAVGPSVQVPAGTAMAA
jgi:hypothetical protein